MSKNFIKELITTSIFKKKLFERKKTPTITDNKTFIDPANLFGGTKKPRIEQHFFFSFHCYHLFKITLK